MMVYTMRGDEKGVRSLREWMEQQLDQAGQKNDESDNPESARMYEKRGRMTAELVEWIKENIKDQDDPKNRTVRDIRTEETDLYVDIYATTHCDGLAEREMLIGRSYDVTFFGGEGEGLKCLSVYIGASEEALAVAIENMVSHPLQLLLVRLFSLTVWDDVEPDETETKYATALPEGLPTDLADLAENEACGELFTDSGDCNWENIRKLQKKGYHVYAGDKDSFGWLTGCIQKGDKVLVYG